MEFTGSGALPSGIRQHSKKQAVNPYLPSWEYVPDGEPYVFGNKYMYTAHMISTEAKHSVSVIMYAGQQI